VNTVNLATPAHGGIGNAISDSLTMIGRIAAGLGVIAKTAESASNNHQHATLSQIP
jgi:hypothetical protein